MDWLDRTDLAVAVGRLGVADFPNRAVDMAIDALMRLNPPGPTVSTLHLLYCDV